jgi:hypothetical protein
MVKIYKMFYEYEPNIIYIGKTQNSLNLRFTQHISVAKKNIKKTKLYNWIRKYGYNDLKIFLICEVENDKGDFAEIEQIRLHKERGFILKNQTNGGDGIKKGHKHTKEYSDRIKERNILNGIFKGEKNPFFGKLGDKNHKSITTHQYSLNGDYIKSFESQNLINKEFGRTVNRRIAKACKTSEIAYGYLWSTVKHDKLNPKKYKNKHMEESDIISAFEMYQNGFNFTKIEKKIGFSRTQITNNLKNKFNIDNKYKQKAYMEESDIISVFEMYQNGLSVKEIEIRTGFSNSQIRRKLKNKYNVQFEQYIIEESVIAKAAKQYKEGISFYKIYKEVNKNTGIGRDRLTKKIKEYLITNS